MPKQEVPTVEEKVEFHEIRITKLEKDVTELRLQINEKLSSVNEKITNSMLRSTDENNALRSDNRQMMEMLVGIKGKEHERKHELKLLDKQNFWKLILAVGGSTTLVQLIINYFTK